MSLENPVSLMDVHSELSCLLHAANKEFEDCGGWCSLSYRDHTYLSLEVEVWSKKDAAKVIARLGHGILWGEYDYRFTLVSHPNLEREQDGQMWVTAKVDLSRSNRTPRIRLAA